MFTVMACMLIAVDREASLMHGRQPMIELKVVRACDEYFIVSFLGMKGNINAGPVEKMWKTIEDVWYYSSKTNYEERKWNQIKSL
jgi:hypothetical protein